MVVAGEVRGDAPEGLLAVLEQILAEPNAFNPEFERVFLGDWAALRVYLPQPDLHSTITPPYMEAFLELQKQVFQLAALTKTGVANAGLLTDFDRELLQINVLVTDGSSNLTADLVKTLNALLKQMLGKMTSKQAVVVIIGIAALLTTTWGWSAYLDHTKSIKIEELKSKDHIEALQAIQFTNEEHRKTVERIVEIIQQQGEAGKRAIEVIANTNDALLKAASQTPKSKINGVEITRQEAEVLRVPARKKADTKIVIQPVLVVDINTSDPLELTIVIMDPRTKDQYRIRFGDNLFAQQDRDRLFESLKNRAPIWAELAVREVDGEIRQVQILRASAKHLPRYVDEFSFRLNEGNVKHHTMTRLDSFVKGTSGKRLTYKKLIAQTIN